MAETVQVGGQFSASLSLRCTWFERPLCRNGCQALVFVCLFFKFECS